MTTRALRCPSCDAPMNPVERRGVIIDLCRDCKGVFLDRGELDNLIDVVEATQQPPLAAEADRLRRGPNRDRDDDNDEQGWGGDRGGRRRKRGGLLGDLFDFD